MKLYITDKDIKANIDEYVCAIDSFALKAFHPYIASIKWDFIAVEIDPRIPRGYISQILLRNGRVCPIIENGKVFNTKEVMLLCEVFPDYSVKIKKEYSQDKTLSSVISELKELYGFK